MKGRTVPVDFDPRFQRALEFIGRRWTGAVIRALMHGPVRFNHLLAGIPGISDRLLSERLRELESGGLVERMVLTDRPIAVKYGLTARGKSLAAIFEAIDSWTRTEQVEVEAAS